MYLKLIKQNWNILLIKIRELFEIFLAGIFSHLEYFSQSKGCSFDRLAVHLNKSATVFYCGNDTFSVESSGKSMTIELSTAFWSSGFKFLCELQAVEDEQDPDCRCGWKKPVRAKIDS